MKLAGNPDLTLPRPHIMSTFFLTLRKEEDECYKVLRKLSWPNYEKQNYNKLARIFTR